MSMLAQSYLSEQWVWVCFYRRFVLFRACLSSCGDVLLHGQGRGSASNCAASSSKNMFTTALTLYTRAYDPPRSTLTCSVAMRTHDISLTCKAAFEAFEQSECRRLQAELERCTDTVAEMQVQNAKLQNDIDYMHDTCRLLYTRLM